MKILEAINYVESKRYVMEHCDNNKLADEVIDLLKRGEKYEQMWKDFLWIYCWSEVEKNVYVKEVFDDLKQKYFPKPKKKVIK